MDKQERAFWRAAILIFTVFVGANYFPVFSGKIPFPRDIVLQFPMWAGRIPPEAQRSYADIGDLITYFYPARAFAAHAVREGVLPLWNPLLMSGEPFLANSQSALFYPLNVPYYLVPLPIAWTICLIVRMFLAALFMAMFIRSIGGSKTGSIFAGIVFASCGFMTAWQGQPMVDGAIWLPFVCNAIHRLHKIRSASSIAIAAVGFAMPVLAGHPETAAHITLTGLALALMLFAFASEPHTSRRDYRFGASFAVAGVLALGLASVQIVPTLEWLRQIGQGFTGIWPPLVPHQVLSWVSRDILRDPNSAGMSIPTGAAYMAMVSILAVPLAAFHRSRLYVAFFCVLSACAIAIAYGVQPIYAVVSHTPILGALKNHRLLVASFAIAALSGLGISALEEQVAFTGRKRLMALTLLGSMFVLLFLLIRQLQFDTAFKVEFTRRPSFSRALLLISLILMVWRLYGGLRGRVFPIAICGLALFDLTTFGFGYMGFAGLDEIFPASPGFDFLLHTGNRQFRIIEVGIPYSSNAGVMYGLDSADGYEYGMTSRQLAFSQDLIDPNSNGINFVADRIFETKDHRLDLLNLKYVVVPAGASYISRFTDSGRFLQAFNNGEIVIFENRSVLPRAWLVPLSGMEIFRKVDMEVDRLKSADFDPLKSVTISDMSSAPSTTQTEHNFNGFADVVESGITRLAIRTQASAPAVLVVSQTYYPGWTAMVDGKLTPTLAADVTLTGIPVPAGAHEVQLVFQPLSFRLGLALTIVATIIMSAMMIGGNRINHGRSFS
jgi:Bacterial membrane protein YfhO